MPWSMEEWLCRGFVGLGWYDAVRRPMSYCGAEEVGGWYPAECGGLGACSLRGVGGGEASPHRPAVPNIGVKTPPKRCHENCLILRQESVGMEGTPSAQNGCPSEGPQRAASCWCCPLCERSFQALRGARTRGTPLRRDVLEHLTTVGGGGWTEIS